MENIFHSFNRVNLLESELNKDVDFKFLKTLKLGDYYIWHCFSKKV